MKLRYLLLISIMLAFCGELPSARTPESPSAAVDSFQSEDERDGVRFTRIAESVWMHTTYINPDEWGPVLSNGIIVVGEDEAILVDTAWNDQQTKVILSWAREALGTPVSSAVFTHAHHDKMGGVQVLRSAGISTHAHPQSNVLAPFRDLTPAEFDLVISEDGSAAVSDDAANDLPLLEIYYPGPGHTVDNIVVRVTGTDIVFGGCLVRPGGSASLGNTAEASISNWAEAVERVARRFPEATIVIPSHGSPGGRELLSLTAELARRAQAAD